MQIGFGDIKKYLEKAESILITSHIHPDGDAIGSCLALYHVLKNMGKEVQVVLDDHVPEIYDILPGFEIIQRYEGQPLKADLVVLLDARPGREGRVCSSCPAPVLNIDHHVSITPAIKNTQIMQQGNRKYKPIFHDEKNY